jgi:D-glycero-beta-D-manno-heptose 1-phosphate adenylyltransferase
LLKNFEHKIISPEDLKVVVQDLKKEEKTIATLNGSFDLLHAGHLHIIYEASQQADILLVALNSDSSIKRYKGSSRPIITLKHRMQMMAALEFVNLVTWFDETTPCNLLEIVKPDVHVNGAEYGQKCIEADTVRKNGGKIHIVELIPGLSTSEVIKKIKTCA